MKIGALIPSLLRFAAADLIRDRFSLVSMLILPFIILVTTVAPALMMRVPQSNVAVVAPSNGPQSADSWLKALASYQFLRAQSLQETQAQQGLKNRSLNAVVSLPARPGEKVRITTDGQLQPAVMLALHVAAYRVSGATLPDAYRFEVVAPSAHPPSGMLLLIPTVTALLVLYQGLFSVALPIAAAKQRGVLRHLALIPLPRIAYISSIVAVRIVALIVQISLVLIPVVLLSGGGLDERFLQTLLMIVPAASSIVALGLLVGGLSPSLQATTSLVSVVALFLMMFGGVVPTLRGPVVDTISALLPLSYLTGSLRDIWVSQPGAHSLVFNGAILAVFAVAIAAAAAVTFRFSEAEARR